MCTACLDDLHSTLAATGVMRHKVESMFVRNVLRDMLIRKLELLQLAIRFNCRTFFEVFTTAHIIISLFATNYTAFFVIIAKENVTIIFNGVDY